MVCSRSSVSGHVDFDFGTVHAIDRLAIWNISLKDVRILASDTSPAPGDLVEIADFTLPNHLNFPFSYNPTLLDLGGVHDARYLRLQIDSVHLFDPSDTFGYAIVGEVVAASVVPEPSACALLAAAALVTTRRARRR